MNAHMDRAPVEHGAMTGTGHGFVPSTWWECPNCGAELDFHPAHDVYTEGFAPEARPDQWRCDCGYRWNE